MKKATKVFLKIALVFFIIGAAFGIAGICTGFRFVDMDTVSLSGKFWLPRFGKVTECKETFSDVESLELNIGVIDCKLIPYDGKEIRVEGENLPKSFSCKKNGKKLTLECQSKQVFLFGIHYDAELKIYIPKDMRLKVVDIEMGVGELEISEGMLQCEKFNVECGVGECTLRVDASKELHIEGGVGEINLYLKGKKEDYDLDIESGIGELSIEGQNVSGFGKEEHSHHGSGIKLELTCGVGEIQVEFV